MRAGGEHGLHEVLFLGLVRGDAFAAPVLHLVLGHGQALDVAEMRHAYDDVLAVDEVADVDLVVVDAQLGAAGIAVSFLDVQQARS